MVIFMEYRKNDIVTLKIEDCGIDGEGIGKADGFTVFVKDAVIGDTVTAKIIKAKKNYGYGRLMEVLKPSPYRVEPKCEFARQCGGCQLQALSYDQQLVFKTNKVKGHLERIGGFTDIPMEPIIGMDELFHYRNKAQFPVGRNKEGKIVTGFYAGRTHNIIENRDCALGVSENKEVLDRVISHMEKYGIEPYNEATGKDKLQQLWAAYFQEEKEIYAQLLKNPDEVVKGTVKELADKYQVSLMTMTGFLDGINDSLVEKNPLDDLEEDTEVNLGFDKALLYKNMVAAEADWLYNLEGWNAIFDEETRKELYKEQKSSTTIVKEQKVYPNDPCPCGSGKKYKKCCGRK